MTPPRISTSALVAVLALAVTGTNARAQKRGAVDRIPLEHPDFPSDPAAVLPDGRPWGTLVPIGLTPLDGQSRVQVNTDANGNNIAGDAANEPSIALDPTDPNKMAIGWRDFATVASSFREAGVAHSTDGGLTWTFPGVIEPGVFRTDPVLDADADGNIYYSSLTSFALDSVDVFKSTDGGVTWSAPTPSFGGDKQWMTVDRTDGVGRGNVYQIWNIQFTCCPGADFTRSVDGGLSFQGPFVGPNPHMKWGTMSVGPDGTLYLAGATLSGGGHLFAKSTTARNSGQVPSYDLVRLVSLGGNTAIGSTPNPAGLLGQVWIATDHSGGATHGNVYVLGSVNPPTIDPLDVMFIRSTDDGLSWSNPVRVNDDPPGSGAFQWFGTMAVAPNGRIDVVWNDTRNTVVANWSELYYAFSVDAGASWSDNVPLSEPFNSHLGWPQQNKLGDYYDMVSFNDAAHLAFAATFNGEQDVYYLRIAPDCNGNGMHDGTDILTGVSLDCDGDGRPDDCEFPGCVGILPGDMNCDGARNGADVPGFVATVVSGAYTCQADMDQSGAVDSNDVPPFVAALIGP